MNYRLSLKTEFVDLDLSEVLQSSPIVLHGVSDVAAQLLEDLKIATVYDLALATLFSNASRVVHAAQQDESVIQRHGAAPADIIDSSQQSVPPAELPEKPVSALIGVGDSLAAAMVPALEVVSIRDLAHWPPYLAAKRLLVEAYNPERSAGYDPEAPGELLPKTGEDASLKVLYSSTILIESKPSTTTDWDGGLIDITALDQTGFSDVAFGAILTSAQTWTPKAVALGQLLHSLPLAPGERTKLTVVDWTRKVAASTSEEIQQTELLSNSMNQSTAISEVTSSVAQEMQEGSSTSSSSSGSISGSVTGVPIIPIPTGPGILPLPGIGTAGGSFNTSNAATYNVSSGTRSVAAESLQNIASRTQQNSSLSRNKRAAIVSEVSESESESINTRAVSNQNHMHALSIQYYEVIQIYETRVKLSKIERCIFIPMRLINFRREAVIRRFLPILIRRALEREIRNLLLQYRDTVVADFAFDRFATEEVEQLRAEVNQPRPPDTNPFHDGLGPLGLPYNIEKRILIQHLEAQIRAMRRGVFLSNSVAKRKGLLEGFDRANGKSFSIDRSVELLSASWEPGLGIQRIVLVMKDGDRIVLGEPGDRTSTGPSGTPPIHPALGSAIPIDRVKTIVATLDGTKGSAPSDLRIFDLQLLLRLRGRHHWLHTGFVASRAIQDDLTILHFHPPVDLEEIYDHLMANQLYYSQQIWLRADQQSLIMQLAGYKYDLPDGTPLPVTDYIDPTPVTVAGNYLAFRFTYEEDKVWQTWRREQLASARPGVDLIPIPTGGVFAEAVLGEFNAAEKLDATRFWKWDDSPIPFDAPEISAAEAGRHQRISFPRPGSLPESILSIQDPLPLPALAGTGDLLKALVASTIFRDMSGADITQALMKASLEAAKKGDMETVKQINGTLDEIGKAVNSVLGSLVKNGPDAIKTIT
ncbi:MAG: hypothetical protein GF355_15145, partial [Candidatus Eisenbacteria bacterium]|nr:hypothetical protein [Candidatus Eisenbacteria bacterium]